MSNYVKKYNLGNIMVDLPYNNHIHELPLLTFSDYRNSVNISLIFNKKSKDNRNNLFNIGHGFKLNIQKRIIKNNDEIIFIDSNGKEYNLIKNYNSETETFHNRRYTFNDESKRVLRLVANGYEIENEDFSKEVYNSQGYITKIYDKYGDEYLLYEYDGNNLLTSISYNNKVVNFVYSGNELMFMTYDDTITGFTYDDPDLTIMHYSGVSYYITYTDSTINKYSVRARGNEEAGTVTYYKECTYSNNNIVLTIKEGTVVTDTMTYTFPASVLGDLTAYKKVEIENSKGVKQRIQFNGEKPLCSYEINPDIVFDNYDRHTENITVYTTLDNNIKNSFNGTLKFNDGIRMRKVSDDEFEIGNQNYVCIKGNYLITGWFKSNDINSSNKIRIGTAPGVFNYEFFAQSNDINEWSFFAYQCELDANYIYVTTENIVNELRDIKVIFQATNIIDEESVSHCLYQEGCLSNPENNEVISFNDVEFIYATEGGNSGCVDVSVSDILRFIKRKRRFNLCDELYINDGKQVISDLLRFQVKNIKTNTYYDISDFILGFRVFNGEHEYLTRIEQVNSNTASFLIVNQKGNEIYTYQYLNEYYDLIQKEVDGLTTYYTRDKGLIKNERVGNLSNIQYIYGNNYIEVCDTYNNNYLGNGVIYHIDPIWGCVYKVEYSDGTVVEDTYDDNMSTILSKKFSKNGNYMVNNFEYSKGLLSSLTNNTLNYNFEYTKDMLTKVKKFGNIIGEKLHEQTSLYDKVSVYCPEKINYSYFKNYFYDKYDNLIKIEGELENTYDVKGDKLLQSSNDLIQNIIYNYNYDDNGLLEGIDVYKQSTRINSETFEYDKAQRLTNKDFIYDTVTNSKVKDVIIYKKNEDSPTVDELVYKNKYNINDTSSIKCKNTYDEYKRITDKIYKLYKNNEMKLFSKEFTYNNNKIEKEKSTISVSNSKETMFYYDDFDRITSIDSNDKLTSYEYDDFGRLVRENNESLDKTIVYEYNDIGNITTKKEYDYSISGLSNLRSTKSYSYDSTYKDRLVNYNGTTIPYNVLGCPTNLNGYNLTWNKGKLTGLSKGHLQLGTESYTYTYNAYGQRVSKTYSKMPGTSGLNQFYSGEITSYIKTYNYDNSGRLIREVTTNTYYQEGTGTEEIVYIYDLNTIVGMEYTNGYNSNTYYFDRNVLGDVDAIYDIYGNLKVKYLYDAYGNCTISSETTDQILARVNPIRYRGYYYDVETGLFWISSRYYNPEWGRWISPDDIEYLDPESVNGLNLYCYCLNDPVNNVDPTGHFTIAALLISIGVSLLFELYEDWDEGGFGDGSHDWKDYLGAGISGLFGAFGGGALSQIGFSILGGVLDSVISGDMREKGVMNSLGNIVTSTLISFGAGKLAKVVASGIRVNKLNKLSNNSANKILNKMGMTLKKGSQLGKNNLFSQVFNYDGWIGNIVSETLVGSLAGGIFG